MRVQVSERLRRAALARRMAGEKQFQFARKVDMHPSVVSHVLNRSIPIQAGDLRVLRIAAELGVAEQDAFEAA